MTQVSGWPACEFCHSEEGLIDTQDMGEGRTMELCDRCQRYVRDGLAFYSRPAARMSVTYEDVCEYCDRDMCLRGDDPCDCACHILPNVESRADR